MPRTTNPNAIRPTHAVRALHRTSRAYRWTLATAITLCALASLAAAVVATSDSTTQARRASPNAAATLTVPDLMAMTDAELAALDPLVVNLTVARDIPGLERLDIARYAKTVDAWVAQIRAGLDATPAAERTTDPLYRHDPDLWRAGGMAVALAGPAFRIAYTKNPLNPGDPSLTFLHGLIDTRRGTCASMPVLYMAIGHRLGWPLKAVVSKDHLWCRWDDGKTAEEGGKRFNLEATSAASEGGMGSFSSTTDREYIQTLGTTQLALTSGSDLTSLTPRQTLGVYLQARAGYWAAQARWDRAEADLLLARACFPENRDIFGFLLDAMGRRAGVIFTHPERLAMAKEFLDPWGLRPHLSLTPRDPNPPLQHQILNIEEINRQNAERARRLWQLPTDTPGVTDPARFDPSAPLHHTPTPPYP